MRLLVSVRSAAEASLALAGGADIIDAKDPSRGALGPVRPAALRLIGDTVGGERPLTAALGDAFEEEDVETEARTYAALGTDLIKVGFSGVTNVARVSSLLSAAIRGAGRIVAVAYADYEFARSLPPDVLIRVAARSGAIGILVDTACKAGPGLLQVQPLERVQQWVHAARAAGMLTAVAGRLSLADLPVVAAAGADVVGVRGAACTGGRTGSLSVVLVRRLRDQVRAVTRSAFSSVSV